VCVVEFNGVPTCVNKAVVYLPNLLNVTVTQTSYLVSAVSDLKLTVQLENDMPQDGSLSVKLPTGYPTGKTSVKIGYGQPETLVDILNCVSTNKLSISIPGASIGVQLLAHSIFNIYIYSITNPSTMVSIPGIIVSTKQANSLRINENQAPASIIATEPSIIQFPATPLGQSKSTVNTVFTVTLNAVLPSLYPSGGNIWVYLPKYVSISGSVTCAFGNGWNFFSSAKCSAQYNSTSNRFYIVGTVAYPAASYVELAIANVLMPTEIRPMDPIYIITHGADGNTMSVSSETEPKMILSLTPGDITNLQLTRDAGNTINRDTSLTIIVTPADPYSRLARIILDIPKEQVIIPENVFANGAYTCELKSQNTNFNTIECYTGLTNGWCGTPTCNAGTPITLKLIGFRTPSASYTYKNSVTTSLYHYDYPDASQLFLVDTTKAFFSFPPLLPDTITNFALQITGSKIAGASTQFSLTFTTVTALPQNCLISVSFPDDFVYPEPGQNPEITGLTLSPILYASGAVKSIDIQNACTTQISSGNTFSWTLSKIMNAPHTVPIANYKSIKILTETSDSGALDQGLNTNSDLNLQPALLGNIGLNIVQPIIAGAVQSASITFTNLNRIPKSNGFIKIILPTEAGIEAKSGNPMSCQIQLGSITGLCQIYDVITLLVSLSTISGLTSEYLDKNTQITISFNYLRNPRIVKPSSNIKIQTFLVISSTPYNIDICTQCGNITPTVPNQMTGVSVTRSATIINQPVILNVAFTTYNPIPATGKIILQIAQEDAIIGPNGMEQVILQTTTDPIQTISRIVTQESKSLLIEIPQYCDALTGCTAKKNIAFTISGLINPSNAVQQNSYVSIKTKDKQEASYYDIDTSGDILITPSISAGQLSEITITRGISNIIGSPISYIIEFTIANIIENDEGQVLILPYTETMLAKDSTNSAPQCTISTDSNLNNQVTVPCVATYKNIPEIGLSEITQLIMSLKCPSNNCPSGIRKRLIIQGIQSSLRTSGQGSFVIKTIKTASNGVVDSGSTASVALSALNPMQLEIIGVTRSQSGVDMVTDLTIQAKNGVNYEIGSTIYAKIYTNEFILNDAVKCAVSLNDLGYQTAPCSKIEQTENYVKIMLINPCSATQFCPANTKISLQLTGFINAHSVKPKDATKYIEIQIQGSISAIQLSNSETFNIAPVLTASSFKNIGLTLSAQKVGELTNVNMLFTPQVTLQSSDTLGITISKQLFYTTENTKCYKVIQTIETEITCNFNNDQIGWVKEIIFGNEILPWTKDTPMNILVKNAKNILSVSPYSGTLSIQAKDNSKNSVCESNYDFSSLTQIQPAIFIDSSVKRLNAELSSNTQIELSFTISSSLPTNSYAQLSLSLDQAVYNGSLLCLKNSQNIACSVTKNSTDGAVLKIENICPTVCQENTKILILINGFINPSYSYTNAKEGNLLTFNSLNEMIHSETNIYMQPSLNIPQIVITNVQNSNVYTSQVSSYSFTIQISNTIPSGGLIIVSIPRNIMLRIPNTDLACSSNNVKLSCNIEYYLEQSIIKVVYTNLCASGCQAGAIYNLLFENLRNPATASPLSGQLTVMSTFSADSNLVVNEGNYDFSKIIISPTPILNSKAIRTNTQLNQETDIQIWFVNQNPISGAGKIEYILPVEYGNIQLSISKCMKENKEQIQCSFTQDQGNWKISANQFCDAQNGCNIGQNITIIISAVKNPVLLAANNNINSLTITTYSSTNFAIDSLNTGLFLTPLLEAKELKNIFIGIVAKETGASTEMFIQFIPYSYLSFDQQLIIDFSLVNFAGLLCTSGTYIRGYTTYNTTRGCTFFDKKLTLSNFCNPEGCNEGQIVTVHIPFNNPGYVMNINGILSIFARTAQNTDYAYGKTNIDIPIIANNIYDIQFSDTSCKIAAMECPSMELTFKTFNMVPGNSLEGGQLKINVPNEINLSKSTCKASVINYYNLMTCEISKTNEIIIKDNYQVIPAQKTVLIRFSNIILPSSTKPTQSFRFETSSLINNVQTLIDSNYIFTYSVPYPMGFEQNQIQVSRSSSKIGAQANFAFKISLTLLNPNGNLNMILEIPNKSSIELIPNPKCVIKTQANDIDCTISHKENSDILTIPCGKSSCFTNEKQVEFTIPENLMRNKGYVMKPPNTIKISSSFEENYLSQSSNSYIGILPELQTENLTASISRDTNYFSFPVTLSVALEINTTILPTNGRVSIYFPDYIYPNPENTLLASVNGQMLNSAYEGGEYLNAVHIYGICPQFCEFAKNKVTVKIEGLKNLHTNDRGVNITEKIRIKTTTSEGYEIAVTEVEKFGLLQPAELSNIKWIENEELGSGILIIYSPMKINMGAIMTLKFETLNSLRSTMKIEGFLGTQNGNVARISDTVFNITNLFPNDTTSISGGIIYGFNFKQAFSNSSTSIFANLTLTASNGNSLAYKNFIEFTINKNLTVCNNASLLPNLQENACVDTCNSSFFLHNKICLKCYDPHCAKCANNLEHSCYECEDSYLLKDGTCVLACPSTLKQSLASYDNFSPNITRCTRETGCSLGCGQNSKCSNRPDYCFGCAPSQALLLGLGQCVDQCPNAYYIGEYYQTRVCEKCHYSCSKCNYTNCTECNPLYERFLDKTISKCVTNCSRGTYPDLKTRTCLNCSEKCGECYGPLQNNCLSCDSSNFLYRSECIPECPEGTIPDTNSRICVFELLEAGVAQDRWEVSTAFTGVIISTIIIIKLLAIFKIISAPLSLVDSCYSLLTLADTINRVLLVIDLWIIKSNTLLTFACGNILVNSMLMVMFHSGFFGSFLLSDNVPKADSKYIAVITFFSFIFGFGFIRILTSGFMFDLFSQPYKKSIEYLREMNTMGNYAAIMKVGQLVIYVLCCLKGITGVSIVGICTTGILMAIYIFERISDYSKYQFINNQKLP